MAILKILLETDTMRHVLHIYEMFCCGCRSYLEEAFFRVEAFLKAFGDL